MLDGGWRWSILHSTGTSGCIRDKRNCRTTSSEKDLRSVLVPLNQERNIVHQSYKVKSRQLENGISDRSRHANGRKEIISRPSQHSVAGAQAGDDENYGTDETGPQQTEMRIVVSLLRVLLQEREGAWYQYSLFNG